MSRPAAVAFILWAVTIAAAAYLFVHGLTSGGRDGRQTVLVTAAEHDQILQEMRELLQATGDITAAIAKSDVPVVARIALKVGTAAMGNDPPDLLARLPLGLKTEGLRVHQGFDAIAAAAQKGGTPADLTAMLGDQLSVCVGCHALYRFGE